MVRKAIIPIAGLGTRMAPISKVVPKAMLPLPDGHRSVLPVIHWICAEAALGGVEEVLIVASSWQRDLVDRYLSTVSGEQHALPVKIDYALMDQADGFGAAVVLGRDFVGAEPFMLLLGDHVYIPSGGGKSCAAQVVEAHDALGGMATIGVQPVSAQELRFVGVVAGEPISQCLYRCTAFVEKPTVSVAAEKLATGNLPAGKWLAHCGIYIFEDEIFDCLAELAPSARQAGRELQLADAQTMLLERHPNKYYLRLIEGRACDTGTPVGYAGAVEAFVKR